MNHHKHIRYSLAILVLMASHGLLWFVGYLSGHIRMCKVMTKDDLELTTKTHKAIHAGNSMQAKALIATDIILDATRLRSLIDNPYSYPFRCNWWRTYSKQDSYYATMIENGLRARVYGFETNTVPRSEN